MIHIACTSCARWFGGDTCEAFPTRDPETDIAIPTAVLFDGDPHTGPLPGDHGKQWVLNPTYASPAQKAANHPFPREVA
jgi:hypothetical protein